MELISKTGGVVLVVDGKAYRPSDSIEHTRYAEAGGTASTAGYFVAARTNAGEFPLNEAARFCSQWPEGPQPDSAIIRLPPTTMDRKRAYLRAAAGRPLVEWIWDTLDKEAENAVHRSARRDSISNA